MYETVTVDEAIRKGKRMVSIPSVFIIFGVMSMGVFASVLGILPAWMSAGSFVLGIVGGWLYWSIMITKWRLWAFENVRNVHELRKRAIHEQLIWPEKNWFGKTEIRNAEQKLKWKSLLLKFEKEDEFLDDLTVPSETIIYYARSKNFLEMALMLAIGAGGVYVLCATERQMIGALMIVFGLVMAFREYKQATNTDPQVILNEAGIQTARVQFCSWGDVTNEYAVRERQGKNTRFYLQYDYPAGTEKMPIEDLEINQKRLNELLILYRGRYNTRHRR